MAIYGDRGLVPLKDVARRQGISLRYLEHLVRPLIAGGMVKSVRGVGGGVRLARPPSEIRISEAVQLLEGSTMLVECVDDPALCDRAALCVTRDVWSEVVEAMVRVLDSITLQDLVEREEKKRQAGTETYCI